MERTMKNVTEEEMREHFDAIDEAVKLRRQLKAMQSYAALLERAIAKREAELDQPIEIAHSDYSRHGDILLGGAVIGR